MAAVLLLLAVAYTEDVVSQYCPECARHSRQVFYSLNIPFVHPSLHVHTGSVTLADEARDPLARWLDPNRQCRHAWRGFDSRGKSISPVVLATLAGAPDPTYCNEVWDDDFGEFIAENPDVLERLRQSMRQKRPLRDWLPGVVAEWRSSRTSAE